MKWKIKIIKEILIVLFIYIKVVYILLRGS